MDVPGLGHLSLSLSLSISRERVSERNTHVYMYMYVYIYIYVCIYIKSVIEVCLGYTNICEMRPLRDLSCFSGPENACLVQKGSN
jgi:hypothetical protein